MKSKLVNVRGIDYEIRVETLPDRSIAGRVIHVGNDRVVISMDIAADDSFDLQTQRGENVPDLVLRLLEDFTKSGFVIGRA
jgi:hypothetical protein